MANYSTGAVRNTGGKGRMDLIPWCSIIRVSKHMENSLSNYPERNWEKGLPMHTMVDSAFRHLAKYMDGHTDEDHLCAAAVNLLMAMWIEEKMPEMQDIPTRTSNNGVHQISIDEYMKTPCDCYNEINSECYGTKEKELCSCGGDRRKCDFYPMDTLVAVVPK